MRILVTGGGGFLGSHLVERLRADGHDPFVARRRDYDLTTWDGAERLFDNARPELVYHLAAEVGGIGANRENPGRYWYANLMMGAHVLELSRTRGAKKVVVAGTVCAYPKFTPVPFHEDDLWNGYPGETNAPYGVAKKSVLVGAQSYRDQYGLHSVFLLPGEPLRPARQLRPADLARHTRADPQDDRGARRGDAVGGWLADTRVSLRRRCRRRVRARRRALRLTGAGEPRHGFGDLDPDLAELIAELTGFEGNLVWDESMPNGQPRRALDASRAEAAFGFRARTSLREGLMKTIAWYREHAAHPVA